MNKNSTQSNNQTTTTVTLAATPRTTPRPRHTTLDRLRQFARAYTYIPAAGSIGGIVLN